MFADMFLMFLWYVNSVDIFLPSTELVLEKFYNLTKEIKNECENMEMNVLDRVKNYKEKGGMFVLSSSNLNILSDTSSHLTTKNDNDSNNCGLDGCFIRISIAYLQLWIDLVYFYVKEIHVVKMYNEEIDSLVNKMRSTINDLQANNKKYYTYKSNEIESYTLMNMIFYLYCLVDKCISISETKNSTCGTNSSLISSKTNKDVTNATNLSIHSDSVLLNRSNTSRNNQHSCSCNEERYRHCNGKIPTICNNCKKNSDINNLGQKKLSKHKIFLLVSTTIIAVCVCLFTIKGICSMK